MLHPRFTFTAPIVILLTTTTLLAQDAVPTSAPQVVVTGESIHSEDDLIGNNQQPKWTAYRRFPTTRVYVLPPWQVEVEQWWNGKFPQDGTPEHRFLSEIGALTNAKIV